jgi:RNA polymerase sigma-70 factor (ECF subfamily)
MELLEPEWEAFDPLPARDLVSALEGCLQRQTPNPRALVELKYVEGLEGARIAERLDQQLRSIYTALSRIHRALGDCIRRRFFAEAQTGDA